MAKNILNGNSRTFEFVYIITDFDDTYYERRYYELERNILTVAQFCYEYFEVGEITGLCCTLVVNIKNY